MIRWKRPGKIEDHRGWALDCSEAGIGFMTCADISPQIGDAIHLRKFDGDRWATLDKAIHVRRKSPTSHPDVLVIGCSLDPETADPADAPSRNYSLSTIH